MGERYPKLSEKIHSERNWIRCKDDWVAHAVELEAVEAEKKDLYADSALLRIQLAEADEQLIAVRRERDEARRTAHVFRVASHHTHDCICVFCEQSRQWPPDSFAEGSVEPGAHPAKP